MLLYLLWLPFVPWLIWAVPVVRESPPEMNPTGT